MIVYLDPEEEITGAVARIRSADGDSVVLVLPPGSRIATSRINFRLLEREARERGLDLVCVSDEPGVRALAISAGVPAYDSVASAEAGLVEFARQDERLAARTGEQLRRPVRADATRVMPAAAADASASARPLIASAGLADDRQDDDAADLADTNRDRVRVRRQRRPRVAPLLAVVLIVALVGVGAYAAYLFVPTATIRLQPELTPVGPVTTEVVADPVVAVVDPGEGVIPATTIRFPLAVSGTFSATGSQIRMSRATGAVRLRSTNTVNEVLVPAGTRVATGDGRAFETTESVSVPRAVFDTGTPGTVDVAVRAVRAGPRGNVGQGEIRVVPESLAEQQVSVNNPRATSGGARIEEAAVTRDDYDTAFEALEQQLELQLSAELLDPTLGPLGLALYPDSARIGEVAPTEQPDDVVGTVADTFTLGLETEASVLAVDESLVDQVALEQLRALVPSGAELLEGSLEVSHVPGEVRGRRIVFSASADGSAYRLPDRDVLLDEVRGKTLSEARAIMETYGSVEVSIWPDFIDRLPDQTTRINLIIVPPTEGP